MAALIVFPAIDLKGGHVVRLAEGDMDRATIYGDDPAAQAVAFAAAGAEHLHVVDLDGAFAGKSVNGGVVADVSCGRSTASSSSAAASVRASRSSAGSIWASTAS